MGLIKTIWKRFTCDHDYRLVRTIHGDEIIYLGYVRSEWECKSCGKFTNGKYLDRIK